MKCRHQTSTRWHYDRVQCREIEAPMCLTCGEMLGLGPANDSGDYIAIEVRAAKLAASGRCLSEFTRIEWCGYKGDETIDLVVHLSDGTRRDDKDVPLNLESPSWLAGYLAHEITIHSDQDTHE